MDFNFKREKEQKKSKFQDENDDDDDENAESSNAVPNEKFIKRQQEKPRHKKYDAEYIARKKREEELENLKKEFFLNYLRNQFRISLNGVHHPIHRILPKNFRFNYFDGTCTVVHSTEDLVNGEPRRDPGQGIISLPSTKEPEIYAPATKPKAREMKVPKIDSEEELYKVPLPLPPKPLKSSLKKLPSLVVPKKPPRVSTLTKNTIASANKIRKKRCQMKAGKISKKRETKKKVEKPEIIEKRVSFQRTTDEIYSCDALPKKVYPKEKKVKEEVYDPAILLEDKTKPFKVVTLADRGIDIDKFGRDLQKLIGCKDFFKKNKYIDAYALKFNDEMPKEGTPGIKEFRAKAKFQEECEARKKAEAEAIDANKTEEEKEKERFQILYDRVKKIDSQANFD